MTETQILPYGTWPSDISPDLLVSDGARLSEPQFDDGFVYWLESRPWERGRNCIVRKSLQHPGDEAEDVLPYPINTRSKAHEYGGSCYTVDNGMLYFVQADDQRIYQLNTHQTNFAPKPITPEGNYRYADLIVDNTRERLLAVREDCSTSEHEPHAAIVSICLRTHTTTRLVDGADFYSALALSPLADQVCWLQWQHPNMPWDSTECVVATLNAAGEITTQTTVAGDKQPEAVFQPQWSPAGNLYLVSDRSNWWNLYRVESTTSELTAIHPMEAEFATPLWVFGMSTYGFIDNDHLLAACTQNGSWQLLLMDLNTKKVQTLPLPYSDISHVHCGPQGGVWLGAGNASGGDIAYCDRQTLLEPSPQTLDVLPYKIIRTSSKTPIASGWLAQPQAITFPTGNQHQDQAHGFFYAPANPYVVAPPNTKPPLIVLCHGGPTGSTSAALNLKIQFWTSRGFAVLDVNYRGSTGYGRRYRQALNGLWGIADVEDVCAGATYLIEQSMVDEQRLIIKGSSAGGYTVLAALTFTDTFTLGTSLYGIGDLETLARDTHKFESRYLDSLVGPYPQDRKTYLARSPIHHIEQLSCPVIFFQGLEDKIVPPPQAQAMVKALQAKQIPVRYVEFANEGHGFRQAENIKTMLQEEWAFYREQLQLDG